MESNRHEIEEMVHTGKGSGNSREQRRIIRLKLVYANMNGVISRITELNDHLLSFYSVLTIGQGAAGLPHL